MTYPYNSVYGAYNNTYRQPYYGTQPYITQPFMQQPVQQQQIAPTEIPIQAIRFLTADQIKGYIVLPNSKELLIDKENKLAYIRSANQMGESQTEVFKFEEFIDDTPKVSETAQQEPKTNIVDYLKKEDVKDFVKNEDFSDYVKKLESKIAELEKRVEIKNILEDKK